MTVGILLVTHPGIASAMRSVAESTLGKLPLPVEAFEVAFDGDLVALLPLASAALRRADRGHGVLILTDVYGASPSNLARKLGHLGTPVQRLSGLNLPMLLRALNYDELPLDEIALIAAGGGRNGVIADDA